VKVRGGWGGGGGSNEAVGVRCVRRLGVGVPVGWEDGEGRG